MSHSFSSCCSSERRVVTSARKLTEEIFFLYFRLGIYVVPFIHFQNLIGLLQCQMNEWKSSEARLQ